MILSRSGALAEIEQIATRIIEASACEVQLRSGQNTRKGYVYQISVQKDGVRARQRIDQSEGVPVYEKIQGHKTTAARGKCVYTLTAIGAQ